MACGLWINRLLGFRIYDKNDNKSFEVGPTDGDVTLGERGANDGAPTALMNRGVFECWIEADQAERTFTATMKLKSEAWTSVVDTVIQDVIHHTGTWSTAVSASGNPNIISHNAELRGNIPGGGVTTETITDVILTYTKPEGSEGMVVSISGRYYNEPVRA